MSSKSREWGNLEQRRLFPQDRIPSPGNGPPHGTMAFPTTIIVTKILSYRHVKAPIIQMILYSTKLTMKTFTSSQPASPLRWVPIKRIPKSHPSYFRLSSLFNHLLFSDACFSTSWLSCFSTSWLSWVIHTKECVIHQTGLSLNRHFSPRHKRMWPYLEVRLPQV